MTTVAVRPQVVRLLTTLDIGALGEDMPLTTASLPAAFRRLRHCDGSALTPFEAKQLAGVTLAEFGQAAELLRADAEAREARYQDMRRFRELAASYWDDQPLMAVSDILGAMTAAERAEAQAILARLDDSPEHGGNHKGGTGDENDEVPAGTV